MSTPIKTDSLGTKRLRRKTSVQFNSVGDVHAHFSSPHWLMTCSCSNCTDTLQLTCDLRQLRESKKNLYNASVLKIRKKKDIAHSWPTALTQKLSLTVGSFGKFDVDIRAPLPVLANPHLNFHCTGYPAYPHFSWEGGGKRLRKIHVGLI